MSNRERIAIARAQATGGQSHLIRVFNDAFQAAGGAGVGKRELNRRLTKASKAVREVNARKFQIDMESDCLFRAAPLFRSFGLSDGEGRAIAQRCNFNLFEVRQEIAERMASADAFEVDPFVEMPAEQSGGLAARMKTLVEEGRG